MQHLVVSHAYGISDVPLGSEPDEQRKKMDSDPDSSSTTACVWWRNTNLVQAPNKGSPTKEGIRGREKSENLSQIGCQKGAHLPSLYRIRGGASLPPLPMWDLSHKGGSAPAIGGMRALPWRKGPRGSLPLHLMGHIGPIYPFYLYLII